MIIEVIFGFIFAIVIGVISLFPAFPNFKFDYFNNLVEVLSLIDSFISLRVFVNCVLIMLIVYNLQLIWSVIMWVVRKIPGVE